MLPVRNRLKREDFKKIKVLKSKIFSSEYFNLKLFSVGFSPSRFAIILSSSVFKKAVQRNKTRRQIKGFILGHLKEIKNGLAVMIYSKKESINLSSKEREVELLGLFRKAKIIK